MGIRTNMARGVFAASFFLLIVSFQLRAEGTYQFGGTSGVQPLVDTTQIFVHVNNPNDFIRINLCASAGESYGVGADIFATTVDVDGKYVKSGAALANLSSPKAQISCTHSMTTPLPASPAVSGATKLEYQAPSAGVYLLELNTDAPLDSNNTRTFARWDISVVGNSTDSVDPTQPDGNIFSYKWQINAGSFSKSAAMNGALYILVPGGFPNTNYVWKLDLLDFAGYVYELTANDIGVNAPNSGYSVPESGNSVTEKYPVYLSYPTGANPNPAPTQSPALVGSLSFVDDAGNDTVISPNGDTIEDSGTFIFTPNVTGTYALTIDVNKDGIYGNSNDKVLLGRMVANQQTSVVWDGTDFDNVTVADGTYDVQLALRIGEYHFVARDVETSGGGDDNPNDGLTIYQSLDERTDIGTYVYWNDTKLSGGTSNLPTGELSDPFTPYGLFRHTWGDFTGNSMGDKTYIDTFVYGKNVPFTTTATVASSNTPPTISGTPNSGTEGVAYSFIPTSGDSNGDTLTFSVSNLPSWASFDTATGEIFGTPGYDDAGTYNNIVITVSDGTESVSHGPLSITIAQGNRAPIISGTPTISVAEGTAYSFTPTASDPDGDTLTFSIANKPSWASFDTSTGELTGTPGYGDAGTYSNILISVSDGALSDSLAAFTITVSNTNRAPTITGTPATSVAENSAYSFVPTGSDADGDSLTYSVTALPSWASFNTSTGAITGTPGFDDAGIYSNIVITVSDGIASASLPAFTITVTDVNRAPTITGTPATSIAENSAYSFVPVGSDADGDGLTYSVTGLPSWASFNTATGAITGTPGFDDAGSYPNIVITVSDGTASASLPAFTITVTNTNRAPVASAASYNVVQSQSLPITLSASDEDGDSLTYIQVSPPASGTLSGTGANLTYTPQSNFVGNDSFTFKVNDGQTDSAVATISLTVLSDLDGDGIPDVTDPDDDNDGIDDSVEGTADTDGDGIPNHQDTDSDGDGIPDQTEGTIDTDGDGIPNYLDTDSDGDGLPDSVEGTADTDGDGIPNYLDVDSDGDGINDADEGNGDTDGDGVPDSRDNDSDNDGIDDSVEGDVDTDGDGIPDYLDEDSDGDGTPDADEGTGDSDGDGTPDYLDSSLDEDKDGIPDIVEGNGDLDNDGLPNYLDIDSDNDGLIDGQEAGITGDDSDSDGIDDLFDTDIIAGTDADGDGIDDTVTAQDFDSDGVPDYLDPDADDDGLPDAIEATAQRVDSDNDGVDDRYDVDQTAGADSDADGIDDAFDVDFVGTFDADLDGISDTALVEVDYDGDGSPDYLDTDSDNDTIRDTVEADVALNDADADQIVDQFDADISGTDLNLDGVIDAVSLTDTDSDGVIDMHDLDSDNDGLMDVVEAGSADVDENGLADEGAAEVTVPIDTDSDGIADFRELDSDDDGVLDIESSDAANLDQDSDGQIDATLDTDRDGIDDTFDMLPVIFGTGPAQDNDGDGVGALADRDDDNDGIADITEGSDDVDADNVENYLDRDSDNDGLSDWFETDRSAATGFDSDNDGIDDAWDVDQTGGVDDNQDGVDDVYQQADTDNDGIPDYLDADSDNDGVSDNEEQVTVSAMGVDSDNDGIDDAFDVDATGGVDSDLDGIDDALVSDADTDGDGILNFRDPDSDGDGVLDGDENGDFNGNGVIDRLEVDSKVETGLIGAGSQSLISLLGLIMLVLLRRKPVVNVLPVALVAVLIMPATGRADDDKCSLENSEQEVGCWYAGFGYGRSSLKPDRNQTSWRVTDSSDYGFDFYAGYSFGKHLFAELHYMSMGSAELSNLNPAITDLLNVDYDSVGVSAGYWLNDRSSQWNLFAKVGMAFLDTEENQYVEQDHGTQLTFGAGAQWRVDDHWMLRFTLDGIDKDARMASINIARFFGGSKRKPAAIAKPATLVQEKPAAPKVPESPDQDGDGVVNEYDQCPKTPANTVVDNAGCPLPQKITLNIQFATGSSEITSDYMKQIQEVAQVIKSYKNPRVIVEGHTDWIGKQKDNQPLSEARAKAVAEQLQALTGIDAEHISAVGYGELKPVADNKTADGRKKNRRVEVLIESK